MTLPSDIVLFLVSFLGIGGECKNSAYNQGFGSGGYLTA